MSYQGSPLKLFRTNIGESMNLLRAAKELLATLPPRKRTQLSEEAILSLLQETKELLATLSPEDRTQLLEWAVCDLTDTYPGIETTAGVCGGAACLAGTRIPVWLLEQYRRSGASDAELLHSYPGLRAEDLVHAWAYVHSHQNEIEQHIRENEAA